MRVIRVREERMDSLIIQDAFDPYYSGRKPVPEQHWRAMQMFGPMARREEPGQVPSKPGIAQAPSDVAPDETRR